jgi:uncharacterized DUF497 family protein
MAAMTGRVRVDLLVWDDWNRAHIAKHTVLPHEAEEAIASTAVVRETYKQRLQFIGSTAEGQVLSIVVGPVLGRPGVYYVFSARPASRKERRAYEHAKGDSFS